jgi:HipA-like protein
LKINKIYIFSQTKSDRTFIGILSRQGGKYHFEYDKSYRNSKKAVALGPEFDLWKDSFSSTKLFPSLDDRIPSKNNPAYADYCKQWGIDENENDPFVLLTTIGRRGPSTFVFEARPEDFDAKSIKAFREKLELNQREFAKLFNITQTTLSKLESGKTYNSTMGLFLKLCSEVPMALSWLLRERGQYIHDNKRAKIEAEILAPLSAGQRSL